MKTKFKIASYLLLLLYLPLFILVLFKTDIAEYTNVQVGLLVFSVILWLVVLFNFDVIVKNANLWKSLDDLKSMEKEYQEKLDDLDVTVEALKRLCTHKAGITLEALADKIDELKR